MKVATKESEVACHLPMAGTGRFVPLPSDERHHADRRQHSTSCHQRLATRWAESNGLRKLNLGGRFAPIAGFESVDRQGAEVVADLDDSWPIADSSVGVIVANDVLEHLRDKLHAIREIYRVLAPGGYLLSRRPSTDGRGAFRDPTHVSYYNENSFLYYTRQELARWIETPVRFQSLRLYTTPADRAGVTWAIAHLVSLKDGYRPPGLIEI